MIKNQFNQRNVINETADIFLQDLAAISKGNKFQRKYLFDPKYGFCENTKTCSLVYIDGKSCSVHFVAYSIQSKKLATKLGTTLLTLNITLVQVKDILKTKWIKMHMKLVREERVFTLTEKMRKGNAV